MSARDCPGCGLYVATPADAYRDDGAPMCPHGRCPVPDAIGRVRRDLGDGIACDHRDVRALLDAHDEHEHKAGEWEESATIERTRAEAAEAEVARLTAIVEGRTTAPTDAEIDAHAATGGAWLVRFGARGLDVRNDPDFARITRDALNGAPTWWLPLDCEGRPTAWPVPA